MSNAGERVVADDVSLRTDGAPSRETGAWHVDRIEGVVSQQECVGHSGGYVTSVERREAPLFYCFTTAARVGPRAGGSQQRDDGEQDAERLPGAHDRFSLLVI